MELPVSSVGRHGEGDCDLLAPQLEQWTGGMFGCIKILLCGEGRKANWLSCAFLIAGFTGPPASDDKEVENSLES